MLFAVSKMGLYEMLFSYSKAIFMFYYNKTTRSDYANCTLNVCMWNARRLWVSGPSLSMCQRSVPPPLRVFMEVGAHRNKPVVDTGVRTVGRI